MYFSGNLSALKKLTLFFLLCLAILSVAKAQQGQYYFHNYTPTGLGDDSQYYAVSQGPHGFLFVAQQTGVLAFDGDRWLEVEVPATPKAMLYDSLQETLWVAGKGFIGKVATSSQKGLVWETYMKDSLSYDQLYKTPNGELIARAGDALFKLNKKDTFAHWKNVRNLLRLATYQHTAYALCAFSIKRLEDESTVCTSKDELLGALDGSHTLYMINKSGDFLQFTGSALTPFAVEASNYIKENGISTGVVFQQELVVGTLTGGAVIINKENGKTEEVFNYDRGLPDDEIQACGTDYQGGLWLAHHAGLTRIGFHLPLHRYDTYPGLEGAPIFAQEMDSTLWVGTNTGLYKLETVKDYEALEVKIRKTRPVRNSLETQKAQDKSGNKKSGFLFGLFGSKDDQNKEDNGAPQGNEPNTQREVYYQKKKVYRLKSIHYAFQAVENLKARCFKLEWLNGHLVALTNNGVAEIRGDKAEWLVQDLTPTAAAMMSGHQELFIASQQGLYTFSFATGKSQEVMKGAVMSVLPEGKEHLWVCRPEEVQYCYYDKDFMEISANYPIQNPYLSQLQFFRSKNGLLMLAGPGKMLQWNTKQKKFVEAVPDALGKNWRFINQDDNGVWVQGVKGLFHLPESATPSKSSVMGLLSKPLFCHEDAQGIWITTREGIYNVKHTMEEGAIPFHLNLEEVSTHNPSVLSAKELKIKYDHNGLQFHLVAPYFLKEGGTEFQYRLKGAMKEWSSWNDQALVDFPILDPGEYTLQVKARNAPALKSNMLEVPFEITPPFWQTWWFHLLEILFFSGLIIFSILLNNSAKNSYWTNALTFLTLILIIEFVQTIMENYLEPTFASSPVYKFALNVILAVMITPLERLMNYLLLSKNLKRVKQIIRNMRNTQLLTGDNGKD